MRTHHRARYIVTPGGIVEDHAIEVADGRIIAISPIDPTAPGSVVDHGDAALVPGLVNAHSHAFQRALRGRTEHQFAGREADDFWTWRDAMYRTANSLTPDDVEAVSAMAFLEMARAGITAVGEFHYLHNQPDGTPYTDPNELGHRVIRAARRVGLRITLLRVAYARAGFERAADPLQKRFVEPDVYSYLGRTAALTEAWRSDPAVSVGMAPHSIRAVPMQWMWAISDHQTITKVPLHIHACEQPAELEAAAAEYGKGPVEVIADGGLLGARTTLVHATHLDKKALDLIAERTPTICACPLTEANLGDGILPASALLERGARIALGTDGQSRIDPWAEMSRVEEQLRLTAGRRNVLARFAKGADGRQSTADVLWPMATAHGARSLGIDAGTLAPGQAADFVAVDLGDPAMAGTGPASLLADLTLAMTPRAVKSVVVGGSAVVSDARHAEQRAIVEAFTATMKRLDA